MSGQKIYYIRHGQTDWNAELRFQGRRDIPLNDIGRNQAAENGQKLADILKDPTEYTFVSSPLMRACETMEIVRTKMGMPLDGFDTDNRLIEVSYGTLEGTTQAEMKEADRELYYYRKQNAWVFRPENGESHADVLERVVDWHQSLEADGKYVVTAHGAIGRVMRHYLAGIPTEDVSRFAFPQDRIFLFSQGKEEVL